LATIQKGIWGAKKDKGNLRSLTDTNKKSCHKEEKNLA
jgi:hypothetical protein